MAEDYCLNSELIKVVSSVFVLEGESVCARQTVSSCVFVCVCVLVFQSLSAAVYAVSHPQQGRYSTCLGNPVHRKHQRQQVVDFWLGKTQQPWLICYCLLEDIRLEEAEDSKNTT